jgi:hypothetical protein
MAANVLAVIVPVVATHVMPLAVAASAVPAVAMAMATMHMPAVRAAVPDLNHRTVLRGKRRDPRQGGSGQGHCQRSDHRRADQNDTSHTGFPPTAGSRCLTQFPMRSFVPERTRIDRCWIGKDRQCSETIDRKGSANGRKMALPRMSQARPRVWRASGFSLRPRHSRGQTTRQTSGKSCRETGATYPVP